MDSRPFSMVAPSRAIAVPDTTTSGRTCDTAAPSEFTYHTSLTSSW